MSQALPAQPTLNRAHPLARGLVEYCRVHASKTPNIAGSGGFIQSGVAGTRVGTRYGIGVAANGGTGDRIVSGTARPAPLAGSFLVVCRPDRIATEHVAGAFIQGGAGAQHYAFYSIGGSFYAYSRLGLTNTMNYKSGHTVVVGSHYAMALSSDSNGVLEFWANGVRSLVATSTQAASGVSSDAIPMTIGNTTGASFPFSGPVVLAARWHRALTPTELRLVTTDPSILNVRTRPATLRGAAAAVAASRAYYYRNFVAAGAHR